MKAETGVAIRDNGGLMMNTEPRRLADRRPVASRERPIFRHMAAALSRGGVSPNAISIASIFFAGMGGAALVFTRYTDGAGARLAWVAAAVGIQLRLLVNLLDGLVAIEGGKASPVGELYNEAPDRLCDSVLLVAAGYSTGGEVLLGCVASIAALFVAYVRAIGKGAGAGQVFIGPMAKGQRMFVLTVACVFGAVSPASWQLPRTQLHWGPMGWALGLIVVGCGVTAIRRLCRIAAILRARPA